MNQEIAYRCTHCKYECPKTETCRGEDPLYPKIETRHCPKCGMLALPIFPRPPSRYAIVRLMDRHIDLGINFFYSLTILLAMLFILLIAMLIWGRALKRTGP